ncbi:MAG: 16S rRNA (adenine(1518)-N(6)/adenine(1519)-N(6))-dimethyltransferase RsmA [Bacteroidetes bacterium]|nr:16S rRNA (adenine(1518)-N(6)/adenine(1519)-N(6))-dimethyltransferase RsmA [Bacteroidota bacterium]
MYIVTPKKHLGQHFLKDENIARKVVSSLQQNANVLEIGPGTGVLTKFLIQIPDINLLLVEIDRDSVAYLNTSYPELKGKIIENDFLKMKIETLFDGNFSVIGNFPYNISTQILFKILEHRDKVNEAVGMFQKEVAVRIASHPGTKDYGILSVLLQAFYNIEYLFTVNENVFVPPPKVKSAVIRIVRNDVETLGCDEKLFFAVVKTAFNQRRKMLRNALSSFTFNNNENVLLLMTKRAEQLNVQDFILLTQNVI